MTQPPSADFAVQDITVDREGRISITNPGIAGRLHAVAASKKPKPPQKVPPTNKECKPNINCSACNAVAGCGPTNSVPNCGCKKID